MPLPAKQTSVSSTKSSMRSDESIRSTSSFSSLKTLLPKKSSPKPLKNAKMNEQDQTRREASAMYMAVLR